MFETSFALLGLAAGLAYLLGSVPFGIVMARLFGLGELRQIAIGGDAEDFEPLRLDRLRERAYAQTRGVF
jgi:hypothetical protein